jgi:hypothetical protein
MEPDVIIGLAAESADDIHRITKAIRENDGYCPCALDKTEDTKCMCLEFREMESGVCPCGLYKKVLR